MQKRQCQFVSVSFTLNFEILTEIFGGNYKQSFIFLRKYICEIYSLQSKFRSKFSSHEKFDVWPLRPKREREKKKCLRFVNAVFIHAD